MDQLRIGAYRMFQRIFSALERIIHGFRYRGCPVFGPMVNINRWMESEYVCFLWVVLPGDVELGLSLYLGVNACIRGVFFRHCLLVLLQVEVIRLNRFSRFDSLYAIVW
mgnify:FL=1